MDARDCAASSFDPSIARRGWSERRREGRRRTGKLSTKRRGDDRPGQDGVLGKKERREGCMEEGEGEGQWHKQVVLRTAKKLDEWTLEKEGRKAGGAA